MLRAVPYCRISTEDQSDFSIIAQDDHAKRYIDEQGWVYVCSYIDEGVSGAKESRPALDRLLADARAKKIDIVIIHDLSRLARSVRIQENILYQLQQCGVHVIALKEGFDTRNPQSLLMAQFMAIINQQFRDNLRFHTRKGLQEKAKAGWWIGTVPYGYSALNKNEIAPNDDAGIVREIFDRYASGNYSLSELADHLNATQSRHFTRDSLRGVLGNRAYCGYVSCSGVEYRGNHQPIIKESVWQKCQMVREARSGGKRTGAKPNAQIEGLVATIVYCAECGGAMWQHVNRNVARTATSIFYYRCSGNSKRTCNVPLQRMGAIDQQLKMMLADCVLSSAEIEFVITTLQSRQPAPAPVIDNGVIQSKIDQLTLANVLGNLSDAIYQRELSKLKQQLTITPLPPTKRIDLDKARQFLADIPLLLASISVSQQRRIVQTLIKKIWIGDGRIKRVQPTAAFYPLLAVCVDCVDRAGDERLIRSIHIVATEYE